MTTTSMFARACGDPEMSIKEIASWTGLTIPTIEHYMERSGRFIHSTAEKMRRRYATQTAS